MYTIVTHHTRDVYTILVYIYFPDHTFVVTCHKCKSIIGMFLEVESLRYYTFGFLEAQSEKSL